MAHELAHNMGVDHDGEGVNKDCDGTLRISVSTSKILYGK